MSLCSTCKNTIDYFVFTICLMPVDWRMAHIRSSQSWHQILPVVSTKIFPRLHYFSIVSITAAHFSVFILGCGRILPPCKKLHGGRMRIENWKLYWPFGDSKNCVQSAGNECDIYGKLMRHVCAICGML